MDQVEISHPDKVHYPEISVTKGEVAAYYQRIADHMLPFIKDRPLTLRIYPHGIDTQGFFQKHTPEHYPDHIERLNVTMRTQDQTMQMSSADKEEDLVFFASQNMIELHTALSVRPNLEKPDQMIFDFDPADGDFEKVRTTAFILKDLVDRENLPSFVKISGSKGVHVHIPIKPEIVFDKVKSYAQRIADRLEKKCPELITQAQRIDQREGKVFIDILRNDYGMTAISPYSLRAGKEAAIATPIEWNELSNKTLTARSYRIENIFRRLAHKKSPWEKFFDQRVSLQ